jgi:hypothetical protein
MLISLITGGAMWGLLALFRVRKAVLSPAGQPASIAWLRKSGGCPAQPARSPTSHLQAKPSAMTQIKSPAASASQRSFLVHSLSRHTKISSPVFPPCPCATVRDLSSTFKFARRAALSPDRFLPAPRHRGGSAAVAGLRSVRFQIPRPSRLES